MKKSTVSPHKQLLAPHRPHGFSFVFWFIGAAALIGAVALTTLPGRVRFINTIHGFLEQFYWGDVIGHFALFGALTVILFWMFRLAARMRFSLALWLAVSACVFIGGVTEYLQRYAPGRAVDRADLMANWLGVFAAATVIVYVVMMLRLRKPG